MKTSWFEAEQAIINTVSYVDVFDYPLTPAEIHRYLIHLPLTSAETHNLLDAGRLVPARLSRREMCIRDSWSVVRVTVALAFCYPVNYGHKAFRNTA